MAARKSDLRALVIYETMWKSTEIMSYPIAEGIREEGVDCKILKLRATPTNVIIKEFWKARGALFGSPALNNLLYPFVAGHLTHLRGLRPKNRLVGAFGSYGWGGGAVKEAYEIFAKMGLKQFEPGLQLIFKTSVDDQEKCYEFGRSFANRLKEYHKAF